MRRQFLMIGIFTLLASCGQSDKDMLVERCITSEDPVMCGCIVKGFREGLSPKNFSNIADDVRSSEADVDFLDVLPIYENEISDEEYSNVIDAIEPCLDSLDNKFERIAKEIQ